MRRLVASFAALAALVGGCETPTTIDVSIDSEIPCDAAATSVLVGATSLGSLAAATPAATSTSCTPGSSNLAQMGDVVIVPQGIKDEAIAFAVMTRPDGKSPAGCLQPEQAPDCIVARRELRFIPHDSLAMRVDLRLSCLGVACAPDETCVDGSCASAEVDTGSCNAVCTESDQATAPADAGAPDGGDSGAPDASLDTGTPDTATEDAAKDGAEPTDATLDTFHTGGTDGPVADVVVTDASPEAGPVDTGTAADATLDTAPADAVPGDAPGDAHDLFTIGGTVSGLAAGASITLENGGDDVTLTASGPFTFPSPVANGGPYAVTVATEPASPAQSCTVSASAGTVNDADVNSVVVSCTTNVYPVGGTVTGLAAGDLLALEDNGGDMVFITADGSFQFSVPVASGATYDVTVPSNPSTPVAETCTVTQGTGIVGSASVTTPSVTCAPSAGTVGGTLSGLAAGETVALQDNGGDNLVVGANGAFTFATPVPAGQPYSVTVLTNPGTPTLQSCSVTNGSGVMPSVGAPVTSVQVTCNDVVLPTGTPDATSLIAWFVGDSFLPGTGMANGMWPDESGGGANAVCGTAGMGMPCPSIAASGLNGHATVSFAGASYLYLTETAGHHYDATAYTFFVVANPSTGSAAYAPLLVLNGAGLTAIELEEADQTGLQLYVANSIPIVNPLGWQNTWEKLEAQVSPGEGSLQTGALAPLTGPLGMVNSGDLTLSYIGFNGSAGFVGQVAEVIIFGTAVSSSTSAEVQAYLTARYGL